MNKIAISSIGFLCVLLFVSCLKDVGKPIPTTVVSVGFCDTITFGKHIKPIINTNCAIPSCHVPGGSGSGDFTTFDGLNEKVSSGKFKLRVFDSPTNPMPASGMLPQNQLAIIKCWLDKGANND